uniref:Uncharacterized protein n=1 Tax=Glossina pallidipes TaxID=7398 RepID=A0A1A9ZXG0_GLOPL
MADEPEWVPAKPKITEDEGKVKIADQVPEEDVEEDFPLIGSSIEDPEQERNYADYKKMVKELKCQTAHLENIKDQIKTIACKACKTSCEEKDLKDLQTCLDREMEKQGCLEPASIASGVSKSSGSSGNSQEDRPPNQGSTHCTKIIHYKI